MLGSCKLMVLLSANTYDFFKFHSFSYFYFINHLQYHDIFTNNKTTLPLYQTTYNTQIINLFLIYLFNNYYCCVNILSFIQFWIVMQYLSEMTEDQTLVMCSGHPQGLFPSSPSAPRAVITNGMVRLKILLIYKLY